MLSRCGSVAVTALACLVHASAFESAAAAETASGGAAHGQLRLVTYNVAGLPEGISGSHPSANMARIGALLNGYDLALVQEDFAYSEELRSTLLEPYASPPHARGKQLNFGDGLSQFSKLAFSGYAREAWTTCNGVIDAWFDCLAPKGFSYSKQSLAPGVFVDVYNVHLDAGDSPGDFAAREAQVDQLLSAIRKRSAGAALLVAGDTNIGRRQRPLLERLLAQAGLSDACTQLKCRNPGRIDRVLYRSSDALRLTATSWQIDRQFVDANNEPLSDHLAVAVDLDWSQESGAAEARAGGL